MKNEIAGSVVGSLEPHHHSIFFDFFFAVLSGRMVWYGFLFSLSS